MAKSVRMADIAQKLGISIVSVSKGLSGKEGVSDEMRARILATAREMGYQMPAKAETPAQRSANIGILVADRHFDDSAFYSSLYRAVVNRCGGSRLQLHAGDRHAPGRADPAPCPPC